LASVSADAISESASWLSVVTQTYLLRPRRRP